MQGKNGITINKSSDLMPKDKFNLTPGDKLALGHMKYAQGMGASIRFANELKAVQQVGRLPFLKSANLFEDVLRGNLGPGTGCLESMFGDSEETAASRLAFL